MAALEELEAAYAQAAADPAFQSNLTNLLHHYCGRPTPLYQARRRTQNLGGAKIYLKREDLSSTPAPTRSATPSARASSPNAWASSASSPRPGKLYQHGGSHRHRLRLSLASSASSTWARKTMRRQELNVSTACASSEPKSAA